MGPAVAQFVIFAALMRGAPPSDTTTYADRATSELVARAMLRHREADSSVRDYRASMRYRLSFSLGKRRWAEVPVAAVEEQAGTVMWQLPNDLRVDLLGRRQASRLEGVKLESSFRQPWFIPRTMGDSIYVFGSDNPSRAAPHPLAPGADRFYHYAAGDSLSITTGSHRVTIRSITVIPKSAGGAYVIGTLWVDVRTGDVARFAFRFVGTDLWRTPDGPTRGDSAEARRANRLVSRILQLDADLEYGLQDNRFWMPYRQVLAGRITLPFGVDVVVPFEAATTFDDYQINTGSRIVFDAPFADSATRPSRETRQAMRDSMRTERRQGVVRDSLEARNRTGYLARGGRYQIHRPPVDSLRAFAGWMDSLSLEQSDADRRRIREAARDLATLAEGLPPEMTGRAGAGFGYERIADVLRYNRVEGTTLSLSGRTRAPVLFTDLYGTVRYGFADERVLGRLAVVRDAPGGRLTLAASRDLADLDPFARGLSFGNSLRGILTGHDDGDYLLAQGGRVTFETSAGLGTEVTLGALVEDQQSVASSARAGLPRLFGAKGYFPENPSVREGLATGVTARIEHGGFGPRWTLVGDALRVDGRAALRVAGDVRLPALATGWLSLRAKGGMAFGVDSVPQLALRAGGINTVRGYDFGRERGDAMWAVQLDVSKPGRAGVKPGLFIDAGQSVRRTRAIAPLPELAGTMIAAPVLLGAGAGASFLGGLVRAVVSHPLTARQGQGLRFDLVFGGFR